MVFLLFVLGNEYRKTPFKESMKNFCDYVKKDMFIYPRLLKFSNLPPHKSCPAIPKVIV
jgi:hypothetical protein